MASPAPEPGGFIPPTSLPSPAPTTSSSTSTSTSLPHPRSQALRAGSSKEEAVRRYIENRLLHISRRYTKKFQPDAKGDGPGEVKGYESMKEVCKDIDELLDVLWLSGTPSLQIPYLLNIALAVSTYTASFPPMPIPTFSILRKLDHAFASLLMGRDVDSGEGLPGFGMEYGGRSGMSRTDMVRCKSLVESTRVLVVQVMSQVSGVEDEDLTRDEIDTEMESHSGTGPVWNGREDEDDDEYDMDVARVYEKTLTRLGELFADSGLSSSMRSEWDEVQ